MDQIIGTSITTAATVISGVILFFIKRHFSLARDSELRREKLKQKESELILRSLNALGRLTVINSIALRDGRTNGELTPALEEYGKVEKEMYAYLISSHSDILDNY